MRSLLSVLLLCLASTVAALSSSGSKLLVVLEDAAQKSKYSKFWKQLEGEFRHSVVSTQMQSLISYGAMYTDHVISYNRQRLLSELPVAQNRRALPLPPRRKSLRPRPPPPSHIQSLRPCSHTQHTPRLPQGRRQHPAWSVVQLPHTKRHRLPPPRTRHSPAYGQGQHSD